VNSVVKIVKRGTRELKNPQSALEEQTSRQGQREIVSTVKGWIAELEQRRRAQERTYSTLINENPNGISTQI
jgi:hypothetical protein